jgi:hypothetical protein
VIRTSLNLVEESDLLTLVLGEAEWSDRATFFMTPSLSFEGLLIFYVDSPASLPQAPTKFPAVHLQIDRRA